MSDTQAPKGTTDIFGKEAEKWRFVEDVIHELCEDFGVQEIRTPMFEYTEVFKRGVGDTTDIVQKEMFTFLDNGGRSITLRPEGTAGVARAYIENGMASMTQPLKLYYIMPNFRAEKPQRGRSRQHTQFGLEYFGAPTPAADAEVISVAYELYRRLNIENYEVRINSIGGHDSRVKFNSVLTAFIQTNLQRFCPLCQERVAKNPLRVLDCKVESCQRLLEDAPSVLDHLTPEDAEHFEGVKRNLDAMGIPYIVDSRIVRGLDYYTRTVFEFFCKDLGEMAGGGGGRYDNLIESFGGVTTPAVGFGLGIERLLMILEAQKKITIKPKRSIFYVGGIGDDGSLKAQQIAYSLREAGIRTEGDLTARSPKAQMKYANNIGAAYSMLIGSDEIASNKCTVKNMETGEQTSVTLDAIVDYAVGLKRAEINPVY